MGLTGLGLLVILGLGWLAQPGLRPETVRPESPVEPPASVAVQAPLAQKDASASAAIQPGDLQAVKDDLTTLQQQQQENLALLRQEQKAALAMLRERLDRLFAKQQALNQQVDDLIPLSTDSDDEPLTQDNAEIERTETAAERAAETHETQEIDVAWSAQAESSINETFHAYKIPGAILLDTECRRTVCRIEIAYESEDQRDEVFVNLPHVIPWSTSGLMHFDPENQTVVFYAAREGMELAAAQ
jgi:hypothetical protein